MDECYKISNEYFYICEKGMFREAADKTLDIYMFVTAPTIYICAMVVNNNFSYKNVSELNAFTIFLFLAYIEMMVIFWFMSYKINKQKVFVDRVNQGNSSSFETYDEAKQFVLSKVIQKNSIHYLDYYKKIEEIKKEWNRFFPSNKTIFLNIIFYLKSNLLTKLLGKISSIALTSLIAAFVNEKYPNFWANLSLDEFSARDLLLISILLGMLYVGVVIILYFAIEAIAFVFGRLGMVRFDKKRTRNSYTIKYLQMDLIKYCSVE